MRRPDQQAHQLFYDNPITNRTEDARPSQVKQEDPVGYPNPENLRKCPLRAIDGIKFPVSYLAQQYGLQFDLD